MGPRLHALTPRYRAPWSAEPRTRVRGSVRPHRGRRPPPSHSMTAAQIDEHDPERERRTWHAGRGEQYGEEGAGRARWLVQWSAGAPGARSWLLPQPDQVCRQDGLWIRGQELHHQLVGLLAGHGAPHTQPLIYAISGAPFIPATMHDASFRSNSSRWASLARSFFGRLSLSICSASCSNWGMVCSIAFNSARNTWLLVSSLPVALLYSATICFSVRSALGVRINWRLIVGVSVRDASSTTEVVWAACS